jgi:hypothetical protein
MYDVNGTETDNSTEAITYEYYVTLTRLINDMTVSDIKVVKTTSKSTIVVDLPTDVQLSAVPLSGYYRIKCVDHENFTSYSQDLNLNWRHNPNWVNEQMQKGCDRFYDATEVHRAYTYNYKVNGQSFLIRF